MPQCVFCQIISGEIPAKKLYEDDEFLVFADIMPQAPVHALVVPKKHIANLFEAEHEDAAFMGRLLSLAQKTLKDSGCEARGGRFVINCKEDGLQSVDHLHVHVLGGRQLKWPPG
jgi:histidine triad (HIT) family protein